MGEVEGEVGAGDGVGGQKLKCLIVSDQSIEKDFDLGFLRPYSEPGDVVARSPQDVREYIKEHIVDEQKHLDLILVIKKRWDNHGTYRADYRDFDNTKDDAWEQEFAGWIRASDAIYSAENFRLTSVPLILDSWEAYNHHLFRGTRPNKDFDLTLSLSSIDENVIEDVLWQPVDTWLDWLAGDLDDLDLDLSFDFDNSRIPFVDSPDLRVLSQRFVDRCKRLDYIWIGDRSLELDIDYQKWHDLLKYSAQIPRLRNEKDFHRLINEKQRIILGSDYQKTFYEHHFYLPDSRRYVEPDFLNDPYPYSLKSPEVFEVKLANKALKSFRYNSISRYLKDSISQVSRKYRNYFTADNNLNQIQKGIGQATVNFDFTLLIGRDEHLEEVQHHLDQHLMKQNIIGPKILSYDALLRKYERIYDRIKRFNVT